jgi:RimJ/RimL family protein N-acetyltransferase
MNTRLVMMTLDEVERMLEDPTAMASRDLHVAPGAMPPDIVLYSALERHGTGELWFWCAPRLFVLSTDNLVAGSGCFKNSPRDGAVEIGCGVAESYRGRNYATEGVKLLVAEGFSNPEVTAITAETADWNLASQRVLEKSGLVRTGSRVDPEDGPLVTWRLERAG